MEIEDDGWITVYPILPTTSDILQDMDETTVTQPVQQPVPVGNPVR